MKAKPFKLLRKECSVDLLRANLAKINYDVSDVEIPDSAYEETVITLMSERLPGDSVRIVIEKSWRPDGQTWEDLIVRLLRNDNEVVGINLQQLLREKLDRPLRQYVMESLLDAASGMQLTDERLTTCVHLQPLEKALRESGISTQHDGKSWWGDADSGGWIYFNCVLDRKSLENRFRLQDPVVYDEYDGRVAGQEAGFECKEHNSAIKGIHPHYAYASEMKPRFR